MAKPKFEYKVVVERVTKTPYFVQAKNEKDALRQIKKNAKAAGNPSDVAVLGDTVEFGKLIRPVNWSVEQQPTEDSKGASAE